MCPDNINKDENVRLQTKFAKFTSLQYDSICDQAFENWPY